MLNLQKRQLKKASLWLSRWMSLRRHTPTSKREDSALAFVDWHPRQDSKPCYRRERPLRAFRAALDGFARARKIRINAGIPPFSPSLALNITIPDPGSASRSRHSSDSTDG